MDDYKAGFGAQPSSKVPDKDHEPYITTTRGGSGYFAVMLWWNPDMGGFYEPWTTGSGRYATEAEAEQEARDWAEDEGLKFR